MLSFDEALARILALASTPLPSVNVDVDAADGRVLAKDLVAGIDLPSFDYSAMDGYAVRSSELTGDGPVRLRVVGESRTGAVPEPLAANTTMRIFTGAPLPEGADAIVMQEKVTREEEIAVFANRPRPGEHVRRRGDDLAAGGVAIARGTRLGPAHLALAAALDQAELTVTARPEVMILATGDELRVAGSSARPGTIPESNTVALRAMARRAGAEARALAHVPDERDETERAFAAALGAADVVLTIGGISVGDHDLVRPALEAVGVQLDFWRVAMKPGKPLAVGRFVREGRRDTIVLGLPGNPVSAMVTFGLFGVPLLRALQGDLHPSPPRRRARMTRAHAHEAGRTEFARASVMTDDAGLSVTTYGNQASGAVTTMARGGALVVIPAEAEGIAAGAEVDIIMLNDLW